MVGKISLTLNDTALKDALAQYISTLMPTEELDITNVIYDPSDKEVTVTLEAKDVQAKSKT